MSAAGTFALPPLPGDHLSITLGGANVMARRLGGTLFVLERSDHIDVFHANFNRIERLAFSSAAARLLSIADDGAMLLEVEYFPDNNALVPQTCLSRGDIAASVSLRTHHPTQCVVLSLKDMGIVRMAYSMTPPKELKVT